MPALNISFTISEGKDNHNNIVREKGDLETLYIEDEFGELDYLELLENAELDLKMIPMGDEKGCPQ